MKNSDPCTPWPANEPLPALLSVADMCRIFGVGKSRFFGLAKQGKFRAFEVPGAITHRRWSGAKVQAHLDGRAVVTRYFRSAKVAGDKRRHVVPRGGVHSERSRQGAAGSAASPVSPVTGVDVAVPHDTHTGEQA